MDFATYETMLVSALADLSALGRNGWRAVGFDAQSAMVVMTRESHQAPCDFAACPQLVLACASDCSRPECQQRARTPAAAGQVWVHGRPCCSAGCAHRATNGWSRRNGWRVVRDALVEFPDGDPCVGHADMPEVTSAE